jgi:hypothetical protein
MEAHEDDSPPRSMQSKLLVIKNRARRAHEDSKFAETLARCDCESLVTLNRIAPRCSWRAKCSRVSRVVKGSWNCDGFSFHYKTEVDTAETGTTGLIL